MESAIKESLIAMNFHPESTNFLMIWRSKILAGVALSAFLKAVFPCDLLATTKGLSQIVTPDVQPVGDFSFSFQWQAKQIGNPYEFQAELGLTKFFEVAVFQGIEPEETIFGTQLAIVQKDPYLLTTGFVNWSTKGEPPQPFLLGGYYTEHNKLIAGMEAVQNRMEAVLGYAYDFNKQYRLQVDFQSGKANFFTFGGTWTPNDFFQVNPAIYFSNQKATNVSGYIVFSFTKHLFGPKEP
jgi:hypothetical protein